VGAGHVLIGSGVLAAALMAADVEPAGSSCSGFTRHPCFPTACSVFASRYCIPYPNYWIGQDLRLTIESASAGDTPASGALAQDASGEHKLDTLHAVFDALRACWIPPAKEEAHPGMQMSVRFAFKRSGDIIATPRVTYASQGASPETREVYLHAISAALEHCTPLHLSQGLGNAIAGRPIAIRFVDNREQP
jgi:hypothetical protein